MAVLRAGLLCAWALGGGVHGIWDVWVCVGGAAECDAYNACKSREKQEINATNICREKQGLQGK